MMIALILPSLTSGGLERVMAELAHYFSSKTNVEVHVIALTRGEKFYKLPNEVVFKEPPFNHKKYPRIVFTLKILWYLRKKLKALKPDTLLSFGGKYNTFVLLAAIGLPIRKYISDRSRPDISYGKILDILNPVVYRHASGIIAQTSRAKGIMYKRTGHKNIQVIGNPIRNIDTNPIVRENIILNVGRFIKSKHQKILLEYFAEVNDNTWKLVLLGDGPLLDEVKERASQLNISEFVEFKGVVKNIDEYYLKSKIFAFTSSSEGFPNVLGEALAAGLSCISYDCDAGPSDLIVNQDNGFLVKTFDHKEYISKLKLLMTDEKLRSHFNQRSKLKIHQFDRKLISEKFYQFISG